MMSLLKSFMLHLMIMRRLAKYDSEIVPLTSINLKIIGKKNRNRIHIKKLKIWYGIGT